jgi:anti-sigma regulatory factor (Ser/Thr protein kinase)
MGSICIYKGVVGLGDLHDLRNDTEQAMKEIGVNEDSRSNLVLMVDEWVTNVISYAYPDEEGELELRVHVGNGQVGVCIRDRGPEFDITAYKAVKIKDIHAPDSKPGGLGIELIRRLADKIKYSRSEDGWNESCFSKKI